MEDHCVLNLRHLRAKRQRLSESINEALSELQTKLPETLQPLLATIQIEASTVHKLLGVIANSRRYRHHEKNPVRADLIVIDEASMLDIEMPTALLQATPTQASIGTARDMINWLR